jgi:K(+)-stimulated pyrophosphate-energized sodium pump
MAADLFETYVVTVGATMVLTALLVSGTSEELTALMALPLIIGGVCILTSDHRHLFRPPGLQAVDHGRALQGLLDHCDPLDPAIYYVMAQTLPT